MRVADLGLVGLVAAGPAEVVVAAAAGRGAAGVAGQ